MWLALKANTIPNFHCNHVKFHVSLRKMQSHSSQYCDKNEKFLQCVYDLEQARKFSRVAVACP